MESCEKYGVLANRTPESCEKYGVLKNITGLFP
jgi:hypothetical protein